MHYTLVEEASTSEEITPLFCNFKVMAQHDYMIPRKIFYRNVEYFLRSEIGAYCGIDHGGIYTIPQIHLTRISLTRRMRDELRVQVILIFWPTKQKIVTISITMIMCMLYCLEFLVLIY